MSPLHVITASPAPLFADVTPPPSPRVSAETSVGAATGATRAERAAKAVRFTPLDPSFREVSPRIRGVSPRRSMSPATCRNSPGRSVSPAAQDHRSLSTSAYDWRGVWHSVSPAALERGASPLTELSDDGEENTCSIDSDESLVEKPEGEVGRPGRGGYNLASALKWKHNDFRKRQVCIRCLMHVCCVCSSLP